MNLQAFPPVRKQTAPPCSLQAEADAAVVSLRREVVSLRATLEAQRADFDKQSKAETARARMECEQRMEGLRQAQVSSWFSRQAG
jgi:hypothetical protein